MNTRESEPAGAAPTMTIEDASLLNHLARVPADLREEEWGHLQSRIERQSFAQRVALVLLGKDFEGPTDEMAREYAVRVLSDCGFTDEAEEVLKRSWQKRPKRYL